jgi:hypothetical protein
LGSVAAGTQSALFEQRFDLRVVAGEVAEQFHRILAAAAREQRGAEAVAVGAIQAAVLAEPLLVSASSTSDQM